jgi:hypothetical protein
MSGGGDEVKPTPEMEAQAQKAAEEWNEYYTNYRPAEDVLIDSVRATPDKVDKAQGIAVTDIGLQFNGALDNAQAGIGGNAGRGLRTLSNMRDSSAGMKGMATENAANAMDNQELQGLIRLGGFGRGLGNIAMDNLSNAASQSARSAIKAVQGKQKMNQVYGNAVGQAVGFGVHQYGKAPAGSGSDYGFAGPPSRLAGGGF